jgi:hypothetical protein
VQALAPGLHMPVHAPELHTSAHAVPAFCQAPLALQVCGWRPEHCLLPGEQEPLHFPVLAAHKNMHAAPLFFMVPVASHSCG